MGISLITTASGVDPSHGISPPGHDPLCCIFCDSSRMYVTLWVLLQKAHVVRRESNRKSKKFCIKEWKKERVGIDYFWNYASCIVTTPQATVWLEGGQCFLYTGIHNATFAG